MPNLSADCGARLFVKRDDCTGLAFGGNKVRQLEFYFGEAVAEGADTVLITGAVQSNFVRLAAAAAGQLGMTCHIQLEERVPKTDPNYRNSGNVLLDRLFGATLHRYPEGEDEAGADRQLGEIAAGLKAEGRKPFIIPLGPGHPPHGALGYVVAARELMAQQEAQGWASDEIVVASGSGNTHAGLLFGLKALGSQAKVVGACVRRAADVQRPRILKRCQEIAELLGVAPVVEENDLHFSDTHLAPGYGQLNPPTLEAMKKAARREGLVLDPVYTAKVMACTLQQAEAASAERSILFWHTGGTPALFAYSALLGDLD